jgi:hypothetical protein
MDRYPSMRKNAAKKRHLPIHGTHAVDINSQNVQHMQQIMHFDAFFKSWQRVTPPTLLCTYCGTAKF